MRAPLRARFKDLPTSDMKEILVQRMLEENYDKGHEDHWMAYEALQTSILRDERSPLPPPPPPLSGASGAFGITEASNSAPPPPSPTPNPNDQSPGSVALGSSKTAATTAYTAWTTTTSRFEPYALSIPEDVFLHEESDFAAMDMVSDDEDIGSRHIPRVDLKQDWFKPLSEDERPLTPDHLEGPAYEVVKAFYPEVIYLQYQMEECHKLLTNQVDDRLLRYNVSRPIPLGGPPSHVTIQTKFFFNKDLDYLLFGSKGNRIALSITKMKASYYLNVGLE
ncbi:hypothetical protein Tco_1096562 [Tanacetum coccineum]